MAGGSTNDNVTKNQPANAGSLQRLQKIENMIQDLEKELTRLDSQGVEIGRDLVKLIEKAKIDKIKKYISKQPD
ncbi:MAG: hypothetical protein PHD72_04055 [Patescibacteria group bacterium]|nr:hypothetical protein [Patescibacteria group bacterium]